MTEALHEMRAELAEALGYDDGDAIYLWADLLDSVRGLASVADAAVLGLEKPEGEYFIPWAMRVVKAASDRVRFYEDQLEQAFGGDRWMTYADPIRVLADDVGSPHYVAHRSCARSERHRHVSEELEADSGETH